MKAWLLKSLSGIDQLWFVTNAAEPEAAAGEVVMRMEYAALNPADRYLSEGQYPVKPPLPHVLGRDGVGVVTQVGSGVSGVKVGDRRMVLRGDTGVSRWGTLAEKVAVSKDDLLEIPAGWSQTEAAGAALVYLTAYQALCQWPGIELAGKALLITGASGGVGVAAIQMAKAAGMRIFAMTRSREKAAKLRELGAEQTLDPNDENWVRSMKDSNISIDLAIDNIGGRLFADVLRVMGQDGRISCVGRLAGPVPEFNTASLFFRRLQIGGVAVASYNRPDAHAAWAQVLALLGRTGAKPLVDSIWPLEKVPAAFAKLAQGPMGKVLVRVAE